MLYLHGGTVRRRMPVAHCRVTWPVVITLLCAAPLCAADDAVLDLDEAVRAACAASPALQAARGALTAAAQQARALGAWSGPRLTAGPLWTDERGVDAEFELSWVLFEPGLSAERRAARAAWAQRVLESEELALDVRAAAWSAYFRCAAAQRQVAARRQDLALSQQVRAAVAKAVEQGERPGVDNLRAEIEVSSAEQELAAAEGVAELARPALNSVLGRDLASAVTVQTDRSLPPPALGQSELTTAVAARPRLRAAELRVQERRLRLAGTRALRLPAVEAAGFRQDQEHGLRLTFSLPLGDSPRRRADEAAAVSEVAQAEQEHLQTRRDLLLDATQAALALRRSSARRAAYLEQVMRRAQRLSELAQAGYKAGELTLLDVLDARRRLADFRRTVIELDLAVDESTAACHRALGTPAVAGVARPDVLAQVAPPRLARNAPTVPLGPPVPSATAEPVSLVGHGGAR